MYYIYIYIHIIHILYIHIIYPCHVYPRFCRVANHQGPGARGLGSETSGSGLEKTPENMAIHGGFQEDFWEFQVIHGLPSGKLT